MNLRSKKITRHEERKRSLDSLSNKDDYICPCLVCGVQGKALLWSHFACSGYNTHMHAMTEIMAQIKCFILALILLQNAPISGQLCCVSVMLFLKFHRNPRVPIFLYVNKFHKIIRNILEITEKKNSNGSL